MSVGRGILSSPNLPQQIRNHQDSLAWSQVTTLLLTQLAYCGDNYPKKYIGNPVKQWLSYLRLQYPQAEQLFASIKRLKNTEEIARAIELSATRPDLA